jgi:hypothetical protein
MPLVGFEHSTSAFKWVKTLHALDRSATAIGSFTHTLGETDPGTLTHEVGWAPGPVCNLPEKRGIVRLCGVSNPDFAAEVRS